MTVPRAWFLGSGWKAFSVFPTFLSRLFLGRHMHRFKGRRTPGLGSGALTRVVSFFENETTPVIAVRTPEKAYAWAFNSSHFKSQPQFERLRL